MQFSLHVILNTSASQLYLWYDSPVTFLMSRDFHFHPIKIFDMSFILNSNLNLISLKRKTWLDRRPVCAIIEVVWIFGQYKSPESVPWNKFCCWIFLRNTNQLSANLCQGSALNRPPSFSESFIKIQLKFLPYASLWSWVILVHPVNLFSSPQSSVLDMAGPGVRTERKLVQ